MAIIKQAGQVGTKKVTAETLQERLNRLSAGQTTNAATAASMGATPQQTAMAGADNRKQAVLKQSVDTTTNLQTAQAKPVDPSTMSAAQTAEVQAAQTAEVQAAQKLASLGGVSGQIGKQAEARLKGTPSGIVRQAKATLVSGLVNQDVRYKDATSRDKANKDITDLLVRYANAGSNEQTRRDALIGLQDLGIEGNVANSLIERSDEALQRAVASRTDVDRQQDLDTALKTVPGFEGGVSDLASSLGIGVSDLTGMSMDDIDNLVENKRKEILGKYTQMQRKSAGTGLGAAAAKQNLGSIAETTSKLKQATAAPAIDFKAKMQIGDSEYDVETILKDEEFSNVIEKWIAATTPEARAKIIPGDWPLSKWLTENEATLNQTTDASTSIENTTFAADTAGHTLTNLPKEVAELYGFTAKESGNYTASEIAAMDAIAAKWTESPLAKAGADAEYLKLLAATPGLTLEKINAMPEADIKASMAAMKGLYGKTKPADPDDTATFADKLKGLPALTSDPMMLKQATRDAVAAKVAIYTDDPDADNWLKVGDYVEDYAKLDDASILKLAQNKNVRTQYEEYLKDVKSFSSDVAEDQDRLAFGSAGEMEAADKTYQRLKKEAALGDPQAIRDLEEYKLMDTSGDGNITSADSAANVKKIREGLTGYDTNTILNQGDAATYTPISEVNAKRLLRVGNVDNRLALDILSSTETPNRESIPTLNKYYTTNANRLAELESRSDLTPQETFEKNSLIQMQAHITGYAEAAYAPLTEAARRMQPEVTSLTDLEVAYKNSNKANRDAAKAALKQAMDLNRANYTTALSEIKALQAQYKNAPLASSYNTTLNAMEATLQTKLNGMPTDPDNIPDDTFIPPIKIDLPPMVALPGGGKGDIGSTNTISAPISAPVLTNVSGSGKGDISGTGGGGFSGGMFGGGGNLKF